MHESFAYDLESRSCADHPHVTHTTLQGIWRWSILALILIVLLVLPILYLRVYPSMSTVQRLIPPVTFTVLLVTWTLGRPLLVLTRAKPPGPPVYDVGVSVVVPCSDSAGDIEYTLSTILAQNVRPLEVLLVENNSRDGTWDLLRALERRHPEVRALRVTTRPEEYAASVAVNYGVSVARHPIVVRMDDDTIMAPGFLERAIVPLATDGVVTATAVNLRVSNPTASLWTRFQSLEYLLSMELERRFQSLFNSILICSGGLSVFRRDVLVRSGGFCSLPKWVSEDMDITAKAHRYGIVRMVPEAVGFTEVPEKLGGLIRQRYRWAISGVVSMYLHREGLAKSSYWYDGMIGFMGLPVRAAGALRDLAGVLLPVYLAVLMAQTGFWVIAVLAAWILALAVQLLILAPALWCRQGLRYWWILPLLPVFYGPLLLATRCAGTWAGLRHVRRLRKKEYGLEHRGFGPALANLPMRVQASTP